LFFSSTSFNLPFGYVDGKAGGTTESASLSGETLLDGERLAADRTGHVNAALSEQVVTLRGAEMVLVERDLARVAVAFTFDGLATVGA
jgi:hypothetical protein